MFIFKQIPAYFSRFFNFFKPCFTKPRFQNFKRLVGGLILSDKKNIQEINAIYGDKDQSSLNRFVTESDWDLKEVNKTRLKVAKNNLYDKREEGMIIIDDEVLHKTGKHMEKANYHRSGKTKRKEWGHCMVDALYAGTKTYFPINIESYLREQDADEEHPFKTKREIALDIIDFALENGISGMICNDAWYYGENYVKELKSRGLKHMLGVRTSLKFSINRKKRISIADYMETLTPEDYSSYKLKNGTYHLHVKEVSIRGDGKEVLLISYKEGDDKKVKCYVTNQFGWTHLKYMTTLLKRWNIECLHRDTKQHLGLEDYQVRKYRGMQVVALAVLVAYTLLILNTVPSLLKKFRPLKSIGEMCRFAKLSAQKSTYWMKKKFNDLSEGRRILNQLVLVKNAKV